MYTISGPHRECGARCEAVLRSLPAWFGIEEAILSYREAIDSLDTFLAERADGELVGFMSVKRHFEKSAELYVLAVLEECHRQGVGRELFEASAAFCRRAGVEFLQVKTLSSARECDAYAKTRRFYEALGFVPLEEFPSLWGPANPALQLIRSIG